MLINDFDSFIKMSAAQVANITHLYLANNHLEARLSVFPKDAQVFLSLLGHCHNLRFLNAEDNWLSQETANKIKAALPQHVVFRYHTPDNLTEIPNVLEELVGVTRHLHLMHPGIIKFHRHTKNSPIYPRYHGDEMHTNLTMSALIIDDNKIIILVPNAFSPGFLNYKKENFNLYKSICYGVAFNQHDNRYQQVVIKTHKTNNHTSKPFAAEAFFNFRAQLLFAKFQRSYAQAPSKRTSHTPLWKNYLILLKPGHIEGFDYLGNFYARDPANHKHDLLLNAVSVMLALISCHTKGVGHLDVKSENYVYSPGYAKLIDYDSAYLLGETTPLGKKLKFTLGYAAPRLTDAKAQGTSINIDTEFDYHAIGILLREMLFPKPLLKDNVYYFKNSKEEDVRKLLNEYFIDNINNTYGAPLGNLLANLYTAPCRNSFFSVLCHLAQTFPDIMGEALTVRFKKFGTQLNSQIATNFHFKKLIYSLPIYKNLCALHHMRGHAKFVINIADPDPAVLQQKLTKYLNLMCKFELISMYLQLGASPEVMTAIENIGNLPDKGLVELDKQYYYYEDVEQKIAKLHPRY